MVPLASPPSAPTLPPIVTIVLSQVARLRFGGFMPETTFHEQVGRIIREELEPRGLVLLVRELTGGRIRFLVKAANSGRVCELVEYPPDDAFAQREDAMPSSSSEDQFPEPVFGNGTLHACH